MISGLYNIYRQFNADIILVNIDGLKDSESLKIPVFTIARKSSTNCPSDGTAIAIIYNLEYKVYDDFISALLALEINTTTGKVIVATIYHPPSRPYVPTPDFIKLFRHNSPVYMVADLNANHPSLCYNHANTQGR